MGCQGLEDVSVKAVMRELGKSGPARGEEARRWLSKPSLGLWTAEAETDLV